MSPKVIYRGIKAYLPLVWKEPIYDKEVIVQFRKKNSNWGYDEKKMKLSDTEFNYLKKRSYIKLKNQYRIDESLWKAILLNREKERYEFDRKNVERSHIYKVMKDKEMTNTRGRLPRSRVRMVDTRSGLGAQDIKIDLGMRDLDELSDFLAKELHARLVRVFNARGRFALSIQVLLTFVSVTQGNFFSHWFSTFNWRVIEHESNIQKQLNEYMNYIDEEINTFCKPSGLALQAIETMNVKITPTRVGYTGRYLPTEKWLKDKHCTINFVMPVKVDQDECSLHSVTASMYANSLEPGKRNNWSAYKQFLVGPKALNFSNMKFPTPDSEWDAWERLNKVGVYIFGKDTSQNRKKKRANLVRRPKVKYPKDKRAYIYRIMPDDEDEDEPCTHDECGMNCESLEEECKVCKKKGEKRDPLFGHLIAITDYNRLLNSRQDSEDCNYHGGHKRWHCGHCFSAYHTEREADACRLCDEEEGYEHQISDVPQVQTYLKYRGTHKMLLHPVVGYLDLENLIGKGGKHQGDIYGSVGLRMVSQIPELNFYWHFRGANRMKKLYKKLKKVRAIYEPYLIMEDDKKRPGGKGKKMNLSEEEEEAFQCSNTCHICKGFFNDEEIEPCTRAGKERRERERMERELKNQVPKPKNSRHEQDSGIESNDEEDPVIEDQEDDPVESDNIDPKNIQDPWKKVRDHCHITGTFRGSAHNLCNLKYTLPRSIPIFVHNLKNYDSNFIIQEMADLGVKPDNQGTIAKENDQFMAIKYDKFFQFKDSLLLMPKSLDELAGSLRVEQLKITLKEFPGIPIKYLRQKGIYPYKWASEEHMTHDGLPEIKHFFNDLTRTPCSQEDYDLALELYNLRKPNGDRYFENFGDYHDFYQKLDVCLLADAFEGMRRYVRRNFRVDPAHFLSVSSLAWESGLKFSKVNLELLTDKEMYLFLRRNIRGGICGPSKRYAKANNPLLPDYNPEIAISYILCMDANNQYGWALMQALPTGEFRWLTEEELEVFRESMAGDPSEIHCGNDMKKGYIAEVDLLFPDNIHIKLSCLPPGPEKMRVENFLKSAHNLKYGNKHEGKESMLIGHFYDHKNYVCHLRMLKFMLELGVLVTKVHRVLKFNQSCYMKDFIEKCTSLRREANKEGNKFYEDLAKQFSVSFFGKSIEDTSKYTNVKFCNTTRQLEKYTNNMEMFADRTIINKNLVAVSVKQSFVKLNKPVYLGFTVLELAKLQIESFWYMLKDKYGHNIKLLYIDTDGITFEVFTKNIYDDLKTEFSEHVDFSKMPKESGYFDASKQYAPGIMKIEDGGKIPSEFVSPQAKQKAILTMDLETGTFESAMKSSGVNQKVLNHNTHFYDMRDSLFSTIEMEGAEKGEKEVKEIQEAIPKVNFGRIGKVDKKKDPFEVSTIATSRSGWGLVDNKRHGLMCGVESVPYGDFRCRDL